MWLQQVLASFAGAGVALTMELRTFLTHEANRPPAGLTIQAANDEGPGPAEAKAAGSKVCLEDFEMIKVGAMCVCVGECG